MQLYNCYIAMFFLDKLIININLYIIMIILDKTNRQCFHHFQNIMIMKELQKRFGEIYLGRKKTITTDVLFIIANIRIDFQMDAA